MSDRSEKSRSRQIVKRVSTLMLSSCLILGSSMLVASAASSRSFSISQRTNQALTKQSSAETVSSDESLLLQEALSVAQSMADGDAKSLTLIGIANVYADQGDSDRAALLLEQALNGSAESADSVDHKVLNAIATGYFELGEKKKAVELLGDALDAFDPASRSDQQHWLLSITIGRYGDFGEAALVTTGLEKAVQLASEIESRNRRLRAFGNIAIAYSTLDDTAVADAGIVQMSQLIQDQVETSPQYTLLYLAEAQARQGNTAALQGLSEQILSSNRPYLVSRMASIYLLLEDPAATRTALDQLSLLVPSLSGSQENKLLAINKIALAYLEIGQSQSATQLLATALPPFSELEQSDVALSLLSLLANTYAQLGDVATQQDLLLRTFDLFVSTDIPEPNQIDTWQAFEFQRMSSHYAQLQDDDVAAEKLGILQQVAAPDWDWAYPFYLGFLAQAANERGDIALVTQLSEQAIALIDNYNDETPTAWNPLGSKVQTLTLIAGTHGQMSDVAVATEGLRSLTQVAEGLPESTLKQELLSAIALAYALLS